VGEGWRGAWWIPDESPGGIGDEEVWIDAVALDQYGGKHPHLVASVLAGNGGGPWIGALLRFGKVPHDHRPQQVPDTGYADSIIYMVVARRWDQDANRGQPYYVARVPD
jgi:hypothetical protein